MLLEVSDLSISYGDIEAVHGINFNVRSEYLDNRSKRRRAVDHTLRSDHGSQEVRSGRITFGKMDITHMPAHKRARTRHKDRPRKGKMLPSAYRIQEICDWAYTANRPPLKRT